MATAPTVPPPAQPVFAIIKLSGSVILPVEQAYEVFALLARGDHVTYDWASRGYKRLDNEGPMTMSLVTLAQYAQVSLNDQT